MFTLTEEQLLALWQLNHFELPDDKWVFFALRGCVPTTDENHSFQKQHNLVVKNLDYTHPSCTLGQWAPGKGFALFPGSTVPHQKHVKKSISQDGAGTNQLLTGCYKDYRKGWHKNGKPTGHEAFRQDNKLPVRRSGDDADYDNDDRVEYTKPFDNLHAAWCQGINHDNYASAGCQVIVGYPKCEKRGADSNDIGPWKTFKQNAYAISQNSFYYVLLTGNDAQRVALAETELSPRIRFGSKGDLVKVVQQKLHAKNFYEGIFDGDFGPRTLRSVLEFQTHVFGPHGDDGIVGKITASALDMEWPVTSNHQIATPAPVVANVTASSANKYRFEGKKAIAPDGSVFAKKFRKGVFNVGSTSIETFVRQHKSAFGDISPSLLNVMQAVSENEGKLEAINTWDNAFLTFGIFQWTIGTGNGTGELPALLVRLNKEHPAIFEKYFGRHGLGVINVRSGPPQTPGITPSGFCTLNGKKLSKAADKETLRSLEWAHRFWIAGHDDIVRAVQIRQAMDRIKIFYNSPRHQINQHPVSDYISSESGVALLLDQHVNRPGHVPKTLAQAVTESGIRKAPNKWLDKDEQKLINIYIELRSETSMTDSDKRAQVISDAVDNGVISDKRGSFILDTVKFI